MPAADPGLIAFLDRVGVARTRHAHRPVQTVAEARALRGALPGARPKTLPLRERSGRLRLAVRPEIRRIRIRDLEKAGGAKQITVGSAATPGVEPASATPLGPNDDRRTVRAVLDAAMMRAETITMHPLRNDATLAASSAGLIGFLAETDHEATDRDFDAREARAAAAAGRSAE